MVWAQLTTLPLKPGVDLTTFGGALKSPEPKDSGLLRELILQTDSEPRTAYMLATFESEEKALQRENDPSRAEAKAASAAAVSELLAGAPETVGMTLVMDWSQEP